LAENASHEDSYKKFILAMLLVWLESREKWLLKHLQEIAATERWATIIVEYMRSQMI